MDGGASELAHWREIAAQKEKEWKEVTEQRIWTLETACQEKEKVLSEERTKFQKLKDDFKYNLKLLAERDQELDRYDATFSDLRAQLNLKSVEISECKIQVDELQTQLNCEQKSREELQLHYQARIREKQAEIDSYKNTKDGELNEERKEFESFKRKLQRKLTEVEEEMDAQKRELSSGFEEAMRKREHEFRIQADEMSAKVLEYELKAKLLGKELELVQSAQEKNSQEFQKVEDNHRVLEKKLKGKDWELQDLKAMKDAMITDLQNQLQQNESTMKRQQEEYDRKHQEMDKYCREKECALTAAKEGFTERESELQNTIRDLQSKLEDAEVAKRQLQWASQDLEKEKNSYISKLQTEIQQLKEKWDKQIVEVSRSQVNKDLELQNIRETEEKLKLEMIQKKEDIDRYKKELSLSVEREAALERSKTQVELDWQRRYEDLERQHYEKSEDFIKKITRSRDEALATVKEKERELQQRDKLIQALKTDREQAIATLRNHGIKLEKNVNVETTQDASDSPEDVSALQEQNSNLRAVIREMRAQMEQLGHQIPDVNLQPKRGDKITEDYVKGLEKEVRELRQKNREMEQDADVARRFGRQPTQVPTNQDQVMAEVKDNFLVKTHIQSLNDLIGSLRAEKLELSAQVKKHQVHIQYQEQTMEKMTKEQREKQVDLDQMQYEIGAVTRRTQTEIASLRQRISELELALVEARKEADEYYKGNLERNMEVVALGQELSGLKIELAQKRPSINYGAQELLIQQLQDEIKHLRDEGPDFSIGSDITKPPNVQIKNLQQKLRGAAKKISELAKEKQQLIEIGNKLRAELKKAGIEIPMMSGASKRKPFQPPMNEESGDTRGHMTSSQPLSEKFVNKLSQLEQLQYQLTRQELQFAQKYPTQHGHKDESMSDTDEYKPPSILKKSGNKLKDSQETEVNVRASVNTEGGETFLSAQSVPSSRSQLMMSMSSVGGESLQEIWKMLDEGRPSPTPRLPSPGYPQRDIKSAPPGHLNADKDIHNSGNFFLAGKPTGQPKETRKSERKVTNKIGGKVTKSVSHKPKIRNYNLRDDTDVT